MRLHHRLLSLLLCLIMAVPAWCAASEPGPEEAAGIEASDHTTPVYLATLDRNAYLRAEPSTDAVILRFLEAGAQVTLLGLSGEWYTVRHGNDLGYLHSFLIENATLSPSVDTQGDGLEVYRILGKGEKGLAVRLLQSALNALGFDAGAADGIFGSKTALAVAEFQAYQAMRVTGIADEATQRLLYSGNATAAPMPAYTRPTLRLGSQANEVGELQTWLIRLGYLAGEATGLYDKATEKAVALFQKDEGLEADGIAGPKTWKRIDAFAAILQGA